MRTESKKISKGSWPKLAAKKWLNIKSSADKFHSDYSLTGTAMEMRRSCSDKDSYAVVPEHFSEGRLTNSTNGVKSWAIGKDPVNEALNLSMFVGTWNVGGKSPPPNEGLNLRDWFKSPSPADIYVIGFQEIVPLNAGNVLGPEDSGPAAKWLALIQQALNSNDNSHQQTCNAFNETATSPSSCGELEQEESPKPKKLFSEFLYSDDDDAFDCAQKSDEGQRYYLAASKQMVGIFLCVWVRSNLYGHVGDISTSCVGRGIMGYLGNKGSISISMRLYQTTFCFVCTHLASGEKEGDEVRRNLDVSEILKKTKFKAHPETVLEHHNVIWLGDLNYRLAAGYDDTHELVKKNNWQALLEKDQLRIEQRAGRIFKGWNEGGIFFAPTYKYLANSDLYVAQTSKSKEKPRTPAWCDRILWKGEGLKQVWYVRGESKFSDHRPVYSLFSVQVDLRRKNVTPSKLLTNGTLPLTCSAKVQVEEQLLLLTTVPSL